MEEKVLKTIQKYKLIESGDKIIVAVSGGPDSMCLLDVLRKLKEKLKIEIVVVHVNHSIREEADSETLYIKEYCEKHNIEIYIKKENVLELAKKDKIGLEEEGRKVRYNFFDEVLEKTKSNKIAIAHNMNDKAETVLMNIIRGSGALGLKGIEPKRDNKYIRPLIETERYEIEEYCKNNMLNPKHDKSNDDNTYTRNRVRNVLIPFLKENFNPNIIKGINKLSIIMTEEQNYLEKIVNNIYNDVKIQEKEKSIILDLKKFNSEDIFIRKKLLLFAINKLFNSTKNIEKIHIDDIIRLCERNIGNKYLTPNKNIKVYINKGKIYLISLI